MEESALKMLRE